MHVLIIFATVTLRLRLGIIFIMNTLIKLSTVIVLLVSFSSKLGKCINVSEVRFYGMQLKVLIGCDYKSINLQICLL